MPKKAKAAKKATRKKKASKKRAKKGPSPVLEEGSVVLEEVELLRVGKLNAEVQNAINTAKVLANEMASIKKDAEVRLQDKDRERVYALQQAQELKTEYDILVRELASKYDIEDPKHMTIDPNTGVVRDLRST